MKSWFEAIKMLVPLIISLVNPKLAPLASSITAGINEAESIPGASGTDKLTHVVNIATASANAINQATGKTIVNPTDITADAGAVISAAVDIAKTVKDHPTVAAAK